MFLKIKISMPTRGGVLGLLKDYCRPEVSLNKPASNRMLIVLSLSIDEC